MPEKMALLIHQSRLFTVTLRLLLLMVLLSAIATTYNAMHYRYQGNNYIPEGGLLSFVLLLLMAAGSVFATNANSRLSQFFFQFTFFYAVFAAIALFSNAVQLTPFPPIDTVLIKLDSLMHTNTPRLLAFVNAHPWLKFYLKTSYASLASLLFFTPLVLSLTNQTQALLNYCFLMLFSALIGFSFYYYFPTTAPASHYISPYFLPEQYATGIKFKQIHQQLPPSTREGGLIACPSFHVIWALICQYSLRPFRVLSRCLWPLTLSIIVACVLLGWHYLSDLLASLLLMAFSTSYLHYINHKVHILPSVTISRRSSPQT